MTDGGDFTRSESIRKADLSVKFSGVSGPVATTSPRSRGIFRRQDFTNLPVLLEQWPTLPIFAFEMGNQDPDLQGLLKAANGMSFGYYQGYRLWWCMMI